MPWFAGIRRDEINWGPTVHLENCQKCGMCMNCGKKVFEWTDEGPRVARYHDCVVGCTTCRNVCQGHAITFPKLNELRDLYKERGVWDAVREEMRRAGRIW